MCVHWQWMNDLEHGSESLTQFIHQTHWHMRRLPHIKMLKIYSQYVVNTLFFPHAKKLSRCRPNVNQTWRVQEATCDTDFSNLYAETTSPKLGIHRRCQKHCRWKSSPRIFETTRTNIPWSLVQHQVGPFIYYNSWCNESILKLSFCSAFPAISPFFPQRGQKRRCETTSTWRKELK